MWPSNHISEVNKIDQERPKADLTWSNNIRIQTSLNFACFHSQRSLRTCSSLANLHVYYWKKIRFVGECVCFLLPTHPPHEYSRWHCPMVCWPRGMCKPWRRRCNWWRAPGPWWSAAASPYWRPPRTPSLLGLRDEWCRRSKRKRRWRRARDRKRKDINGKKKTGMGEGAGIKVKETINTICFCHHFMVIAHFTGFIRAARLGNS